MGGARRARRAARARLHACRLGRSAPPAYWSVFAIFGVEAWALGVFSSYQVLFLQAQGVGSLASSGALGFAAGVAAVAGILFSRLTDKFSPYYTLIGSVLFLSVLRNPGAHRPGRAEQVLRRA